MASRVACALALIAAAVSAQEPGHGLMPPPGMMPPPPTQFTTAPQCKCSDIDACSAEIAAETDRCKEDPSCTDILAATGGDVAKVRSCLDGESKIMQSIEACVKETLGAPIGCTNDAVPANLTIPLVPVIEIPFDEPAPTRRRRTASPESVGAPPELAQYLVCVDQCAMAPKETTRAKRSAIACAYKLQCALAPPDDAVHAAFKSCETKLNIDPEGRFRESCRCLKEAGIASMKCDA